MKRNVIEGKIQGNEKGYAFLIPTDPNSEDYFISHSNLRGAMHGDIVLAESIHGEGERTNARVLKVITRGIEKLVGTYFTCKTGGFVKPDDKKYFNDIFVPFGKSVRAKSGDKVVCKIIAYPKKQNPEGIITEVLGRQFNKQAEIKSILFNYKLPDKFPQKVLLEAKSLPIELTKSDKKGRKDFTKKLCFTIDGEDAKDFDDAVSIEKNEKGDFVLGVHIADVSHYVKSKNDIDNEAFLRSTSVYFPERVIPMLPEILSNDLCSLKEGVERLTLSCIMTINNEGKVIDSYITPSIIKSKARLTYTKVQKILDGDKELIKQYKKLTDSIFMMDDLSDLLIERSDKEGRINLDVKESAIFVSKDGDIIVENAKRDKAHRIIEEFMILANVSVAEFIYYTKLPFVYRVHEKPSEEKLQTFYDFLRGLGITAKRNKDTVYSKDFQKILKNAEDTPYYTMINRVMLRSMQKARYSPEDVGHFGLSLKHYCHFTSPIRRYPDLVVHRIVKDLLKGETDIETKYSDFVYGVSKHSSEKEINANEAERAIDDYYKLLYIDDYIGQSFYGVISGVTNFGIFVELENGVEGIIKLENLKVRGRYLKFDKQTFTLSDGKITYKLGQKVKIMVAGVNLSERRAEFIIEN